MYTYICECICIDANVYMYIRINAYVYICIHACGEYKFQHVVYDNTSIRTKSVHILCNA